MSGEFELLAVGGGPAGFSAARAYRESGGDGAVAIIADEHRVPYNRPPLSKDLLREETSEQELPLEDELWFSAHGVELVSGRAVSLDPHERVVTLSGGRELRYRSCVLATGAEPTRIPVPGGDDPAVRVLRSLDHLRELKLRLEPGSRPVVIGSGFIGCEIAASLRMLGHPVTLVSDETAPNLARLGEEAAREIAGWLRDEGVQLRLGAEVAKIERRGGGLEVLAGDERSAGTVVVMATGVAPRLELAVDAGAALDGGAIAADAQMRTSLPGLLAAGDACAAENSTAGRRLRVEHWGDALGQGKVAGRTAAGAAARWDDVPGFWSTIGNRILKYAAWGDGFQEARFEPRGDGAFVVWYGQDGRLAGVLAHGCDDDYDRGRKLIAEGAQWS
ncbi:MAG: NAD(P)/FAD-dependent oxidoreductase [Solirubrobacteraceae bacterium]